MASDADLIDQVTKSAGLLGAASAWDSIQVLNPKDNFVYELYVLFRVLLDLKKSYSIKFVAGKPKATFARAPAPKKGRPKFLLMKNGQIVAQVCAGTKIADIHGSLTAPDISIQSFDSPDSPSYKDVLQIFDAKYRSKPTKGISEQEFAVFERWVELFELRAKGSASLEFDMLPFLDGNCLITNGMHSTEKDVERKRVNVIEVFGFSPKGQANVKP